MSSRSIARVAGDLVEVTWPVLLLSILGVVIGVLPPGSPLRLTVALVATLVLPGYVFSLATFPLSTPSGRGNDAVAGGGFSLSGDTTRGNDWTLPSLGTTERWVVSLGFSVGLIPVYGLVIAVAGLSFDVPSILTVVLAFASLFTLVAFVRRLRLPEHVSGRAADFPSMGRLGDLVDAPTRRGALSNGLVVVGFLLAAGSLGVAITVPAEDPEYTTVSLLTENESGKLVSAGYPHDLQPGDSGRLVFALTNHEDQSVDYSVVVQSQQVDREGNVVQSRQLNQFVESVGDEETWERPHQITPQLRGDRVRVVYLVYRGEVPTDPTIQNAYRSLTLWIREPMPGETAQSMATVSVSPMTGPSHAPSAMAVDPADDVTSPGPSGDQWSDSATINYSFR